MPQIAREALLQEHFEQAGWCSVTWRFLRGVAQTTGAEVLIGGTSITCPPYFRAMGRCCTCVRQSEGVSSSAAECDLCWEASLSQQRFDGVLLDLRGKTKRLIDRSGPAAQTAPAARHQPFRTLSVSDAEEPEEVPPSYSFPFSFPRSHRHGGAGGPLPPSSLLGRAATVWCLMVDDSQESTNKHDSLSLLCMGMHYDRDAGYEARPGTHGREDRLE